MSQAKITIEINPLDLKQDALTEQTNQLITLQTSGSNAEKNIVNWAIEKAAFEAFNNQEYETFWRRSSSGDGWTEGTNGETASDWGVNAYTTRIFSNTFHIVGETALKLSSNSGDLQAYYPSTNANWDFSVFPPFTRPTLNFYALSHTRGLSFNFWVRLIDADGDWLLTDLTNILTGEDNWCHVELPIGTYYKSIHVANSWGYEAPGLFDWAHVDHIQFEYTWLSGVSPDFYIDGLHFGGVPIIRIARQEFPDEIVAGRGTLGTEANPICYKVLRDDVGKDDSLNASDDSGTLAQYAKSALLTAVKPTENGTFTTEMIPDILPGQLVYINGKDWRIKKVTHILETVKTRFEVTDDLTNSHTRLRYEDQNKIYAALRPEWQDREAASLKVGEVDIRTKPLEKAYDI
jgi:hypothetical protein